MAQWKKFQTARPIGIANEDARTEVACALMMGGRFIDKGEQYAATRFSCVDDTLSVKETGYWMHKANAARAYLSCYDIFFDRAGNPIGPSPVATVGANGRDKP